MDHLESNGEYLRRKSKIAMGAIVALLIVTVVYFIWQSFRTPWV